MRTTSKCIPSQVLFFNKLLTPPTQLLEVLNSNYDYRSEATVRDESILVAFWCNPT